MSTHNAMRSVLLIKFYGFFVVFNCCIHLSKEGTTPGKFQRLPMRWISYQTLSSTAQAHCDYCSLSAFGFSLTPIERILYTWSSYFHRFEEIKASYCAKCLIYILKQIFTNSSTWIATSLAVNPPRRIPAVNFNASRTTPFSCASGSSQFGKADRKSVV